MRTSIWRILKVRAMAFTIMSIPVLIFLIFEKKELAICWFVFACLMPLLMHIFYVHLLFKKGVKVKAKVRNLGDGESGKYLKTTTLPHVNAILIYQYDGNEYTHIDNIMDLTGPKLSEGDLHARYINKRRMPAAPVIDEVDLLVLPNTPKYVLIPDKYRVGRVL